MNKDYVLSVEDSREDIALMKRIFEQKIPKYEIKHIKDGESAIQFFESLDFEDHPPRCILLDIKLPKMNGLEVLNYLRNKKKIENVPVIMLSSSDRAEEIDMTYSLGGNSYIEKPRSYIEMKEKIPFVIQYWLEYNKTTK